MKKIFLLFLIFFSFNIYCQNIRAVAAFLHYYQLSYYATHYYYDTTIWYQIFNQSRQNEPPYPIGLKEDDQLRQDVINFVNSFNENIPWCPICDGIEIYPNSLPNAFIGESYYVQLSSSSNNFPLSWKLKSGTLPYELNLSKNNGIISGIPNVSGIYDFSVFVMDNSYKNCIGEKDYTIVSCPDNELLIDVENLWQGRVGENFYKLLNVYCGVEPYTVTISSGNLPANINITGLAFQGIPQSSGYYSFTIKVQDVNGKTGQKDIQFIVFPSNSELLAVPNAGTTAGGTEVEIYSYSGVFKPQTNVFFTIKSGNNQVGASPAEEVLFISEYKIKVKTPKHIEGLSDIVVSISSTPNPSTYTLSNGYRFAPLAFTSNQTTQDMSVIDTTFDQLFDTNQKIPSINPLPFDEPIVPMGMEFSKTEKPGRFLYLVDFYSGNLKVIDAANFKVVRTVILQNPEIAHFDPGAFDVAISEDGKYAYVIHMTPGTAHIEPPIPYNPSGSVSVIYLNNNVPPPNPILIDIDSDPSTTSIGAPEGITRIEPPPDWGFVPLSIEDVAVFKPVMMYNVGDKWPGEYLFISGVGPAEWSWIPDPNCKPSEICPVIRILNPRPIEVAVVDINPYVVTGIVIINGVPYPELRTNFMYRSFIKKIKIGTDGEFPSNQGLSFYVFQELRDKNAYVYAVNPVENKIAIIDFNTLEVLKDNLGNPIYIQTGNNPTDVKVQEVPNKGTYAYIANANDDSVSIIDTATNTELPSQYSPIYQDLQCNALDHYPTSFDTRDIGDKGYSSDFHSNTVSVYDLPNSIMRNYPYCQIDVGGAPIRIKVQPVMLLEDIGGPIQKSLTYADPSNDFTEPPKQSILINDWENVQHLQETNANPKAVLANIENFQKNMNKWVKNEDLKLKLDEDVELYKATYKALNGVK